MKQHNKFCKLLTGWLLCLCETFTFMHILSEAPDLPLRCINTDSSHIIPQLDSTSVRLVYLFTKTTLELLLGLIQVIFSHLVYPCGVPIVVTGKNTWKFIYYQKLLLFIFRITGIYKNTVWHSELVIS